MSLQRTKLTDVVLVSNTTGAIYTNINGEVTYIKGFLAHATHSSPVDFSLFMALSGSASGNLQNRLFRYTLEPAETSLIDFPYSLVLTGTNTIRANSSWNAGINIVLMGDKDTP